MSLLERLLQVSRRTVLGVAVGIVAVAALAVAGWFWYSAEQNRALAAYVETMARVRAAQASQAKPEDRAAAARDLEATLARFPSSGAAGPAAYQLAGLRYDAGEYAAARGAYQIVLARAGSATLRTLARAGIGYTWESEREHAKAVDAYQAALAGLGPKDFYYEPLLLDLGRGQELAGRKAEAIETYRRVLKELPQARRAEEVRARLLNLGAS